MNSTNLKIKRALRIALLFLLLSVAGMMKSFAQPQGALNGLFSVSNLQKVYFSQGNLQYQATTNTWRFAENQWDYVGDANNNIGQNYSGWIDLFGWGTSGYDHGATCYQPWSTNDVHTDYYAYGNWQHDLYDQSGKADWGYNAIANGGNQTNQWHTLTHEEWNYVFNTRSTTSGIRYAKATVNNVYGVLLLPDNWSSSIYSLNDTNDNEANYNSNILTATQWRVLEQKGVVFLPAAGRRYGTDIGEAECGSYWSATHNDSWGVYQLNFNNDGINTRGINARDNGISVRLAKTAQDNGPYTINTTCSPANGGTVTGGGTYQQGQTCALTATANSGYTFGNWTENGSVVSTNANYTFTVTGNRSLVANFTCNSIGDHEYVDLGLPSGTLWATCNVGAATPEGCGDYFAWGETTPKNVYNWDTYLYYNGSSLTKYTGSDGLTTLLPEDDAATANWGNGWHMPTKDEIQELYNNTTVTWTTLNGVNGRLFTATNGNSIFLPAAGYRNDSNLYLEGSYGLFWSSSLYMDYPVTAWFFYFNSDYYKMGDYGDRYYGQSVRPVHSMPQNNVPTGAINGLFSVSENQQAYFSKGNLQYQASTNTWRFAEHQWDCQRLENTNISSSYDGWIDLFGWGTSGNDHGAVCYQPWSTSTNGSDYYAYGSSTYNLYDQTGQADWGYNAIGNGGNTQNKWRTLTSDEWSYLLFNRDTPSGIRFAKAKVNDVEGLVVLPDNWDSSIYGLQNTNTVSAIYTSNIITENDWASVLEPHGVLFLPAGSYRSGSSYIENLNKGYYWTSTRSGGGSAGYFEFNNIQSESIGLFVGNRGLNQGLSVRLARTIHTINITCLPTEGGTVTGAGTYNAGETCTLTATANAGYTFYNWTENGNVVSTNVNYTFTVTANRNLIANFIVGNNLVFNGDFELGNTGFNTDYIYENTGTANHYYVGHDIAEMWSWDSPGYAVGDHTTGEGLFMMVDAALQPNSLVWEQSVTVTPNTDYVFSAWFLTNDTGYFRFEINGISGPDMTTPESCWVWEQQSMTWNSGNNTEATLKIINRYAEYGGYDYGIDDICFSALTGTLSGIFSISDSRQVYFSQGNLQYQATTNTWRFAENQWDYVGDANSNIGPDNSGWIDLFGWGTSGYNHGAICYQPWSSITIGDHYCAYGQSDYNLYDQTGQADWGYNAISNGGNQENQWRTLTKNEWNYVFNNRNTTSGIRYAKANISGVDGVILLPDGWDVDTYALSNTNDAGANFSSNILTASQWSTLEQNGAVFLPAAGRRRGTTMNDLGSGGYWSSTCGAYRVYFDNGRLDATNWYFRDNGFSVRLVRAIQYTIISASLPAEGGTVTGAGTYNSGETCTLTATANSGYTFTNWTENGTIVSTDAVYSFTVSENRTLVANFSNGMLSGVFSVSNNTKVCFSQGNLQYQATTNTWRFAEDQWDFLGFENESVSSTYDGWIDLFGWGTSGYNHGAVYYQPWSTSGNSSDYYAYGSSEYNLYDQTGQADWGYNAISNGGNTENQWRTLTIDEWSYLLMQRNTPSGIRFAKAIVNNVKGLVVLPDNWDASYYDLNETNSTSANYLTNIITENDWTSVLEPHGALFLPAGSYRRGTSVENNNPFKGYYWSSSCLNEWGWDWETKYVEFNDMQLFFGNRSRDHGLSVRLVRTVQEGITQTTSLNQGWNWWSTNLDITLNDLKEALVETVPGTSVTIKSRTANTAFNPGTNQWRGTLTSFDVAQMYMIYVNADCEITLTGMPINPSEHPVTIHNGVNWIAFPFTESMSVSEAFAGFAVEGDIVKSRMNNTSYTNGQWRGGLNTLVPGQGYIYKSNAQEDRTLIFGANNSK